MHNSHTHTVCRWVLEIFPYWVGYYQLMQMTGVDRSWTEICISAGWTAAVTRAERHDIGCSVLTCTWYSVLTCPVFTFIYNSAVIYCVRYLLTIRLIPLLLLLCALSAFIISIFSRLQPPGFPSTSPFTSIVNIIFISGICILDLDIQSSLLSTDHQHLFKCIL